MTIKKLLFTKKQLIHHENQNTRIVYQRMDRPSLINRLLMFRKQKNFMFKTVYKRTNDNNNKYIRSNGSDAPSCFM